MDRYAKASKYAKAFAKAAVVVGSEDDPKVYDGKWFDVWICPDLERDPLHIAKVRTKAEADAIRAVLQLALTEMLRQAHVDGSNGLEMPESD